MAERSSKRSGMGKGLKRSAPPPQAPTLEEDRTIMVDGKYGNDLPQPPVPKLLKALPAAERLFQYRTTTLELEHRPILLSEEDILLCVERSDPDAYGAEPVEGAMGPPLHPLDAALLRDDDHSAERMEAEGKRKKLSEKTEAFHREAFGLQLPQLISNDVFTERQRYTTGLDAAEKKIEREPPGYKDMKDYTNRIEKTFEDAKSAPVHPTKPGLKAKRVMSVVPDAVLWGNKYRQISFDEMPREPRLHDILFKTVPTPRVTAFGAFHAPDGVNAAGGGAFSLVQNYIWDNRGAFTRSIDINEGEALLMSLPPESENAGEVRFVVVPPMMKLKKQRAHRLDLTNINTQSLTVSHRDPSTQEDLEIRERMKTVLEEEVDVEDATTFQFENGEWHIKGDRAVTATDSHDE